MGYGNAPPAEEEDTVEEGPLPFFFFLDLRFFFPPTALEVPELGFEESSPLLSEPSSMAGPFARESVAGSIGGEVGIARGLSLASVTSIRSFTFERKPMSAQTARRSSNFLPL